MIVKIKGNHYESEIIEVNNGEEEKISEKLMKLQSEGIEGLHVVQITERDVTDQFALRFVERDGTKMFIGNGNQPAFVSQYKLKDTKERKGNFGTKGFIGANEQGVLTAKKQEG